MKNIMKTLIVSILALALAPEVFAQSAPTKTTLSVAMAAGARQMTVSSATGFSASTASQQYFVLIENDLRQVLAVNSTVISLGPAKGAGVGHVASSTVIFGTPGVWSTGTAGVGSGSVGNFVPSTPTGACTRSNNQYLPLFYAGTTAVPNSGATIDCLGGKWVAGTLPDAPGLQLALAKVCTVPIGNVAYGSFGTSTTPSTTGELTASIFVPQTMLATGITNLNGSAVDTGSKKIVILHDATGNLIATSAVAGTAATGSDAFQAIPFTATALITGPAYYFVGLQDDTADANGVRTIATATFNNVIASQLTSVFGTVGSITVPTTFTADQGPIACIY